MFNRSAASLEDGRVHRNIRVYDCRSENEEQAAVKSLETSGLDFSGFLQLLRRVMLANFYLLWFVETGCLQGRLSTSDILQIFGLNFNLKNVSYYVLFTSLCNVFTYKTS